jgi:glycine cleavage system aminomethyltransferase T
MSVSAEKCLSCGMPLTEESRRAETDYCLHCADETGALQPFEERFERMTQWAMRKDGLSREAAESSTREYMRQMPAWRDHPKLRVLPAS